MDLDEQRLVELSRNGDQMAFTGLVQRCRRFIFSIAYKIALNEEDALDITQNVYIRLCRDLHRFQGGSFRAWLAVMTARIAIDHLRRAHAKEHPFEQEALHRLCDQADQALPEQYQRMEQKERIDLVEQSMTHLSAQQRTVLTLRYMDDMSNKQIAEACGITESQVRVQTTRAIQKLRSILNKNDRA